MQQAGEEAEHRKVIVGLCIFYTILTVQGFVTGFYEACLVKGVS